MVTRSDLEDQRTDLASKERQGSGTGPQRPPYKLRGNLLLILGGETATAKKHKSGSSQKHRSSSLPGDAEFVKRNFEAYYVDPVSASINVFQHLASYVLARAFKSLIIYCKSSGFIQRFVLHILGTLKHSL